jgi:hypothetical protein
MIELPLLLYLVSNVLIAFSFFFLRKLRSIQDQNRHRFQFLTTTVVVSLFLVMVFVATLLAFEFVVVAKPEVEGSFLCPVVIDRSGDALAIKIVYISIILGIALVIGVVELFMGVSVYYNIRDVYGSKRILLLSLASSIGIISDSTAFLAYYIINTGNPYFVIVLIFTEILPISVIIYYTSFGYVRRRISSRETSQKWTPSQDMSAPPLSLSRATFSLSRTAVD